MAYTHAHAYIWAPPNVNFVIFHHELTTCPKRSKNLNTLSLPRLAIRRHLEMIQGPGNEVNLLIGIFAFPVCGVSSVNNALICRFGGREFESH